MTICVAGWHYHTGFIPFNTQHPIFTVCHREPPARLDCSVVIRNVGLEFGCYDWYLKNRWQEGAVLFLHDDNEITQDALDQCAGITQDQVFLFGSAEEADANGKAHGRAFYCSEKFLKRLKADGGFWYNEAPETSSEIPATAEGVPDYHNLGIKTFVAYLKSLPRPEYRVNCVGILPGLKTGYRGRI